MINIYFLTNYGIIKQKNPNLITFDFMSKGSSYRETYFIVVNTWLLPSVMIAGFLQN